MIKRMIFHIPLNLNPSIYSGSQIRPLRMIEAFKELNFDVVVVMGSSRERKKQINHIKKQIRAGLLYDFLYSESSTMPTALTDNHHLPLHPILDFNFFKFCRGHNIRVGLFYRDIHWNFEQYKNNVSRFKRVVSTFFYKYDLLQYKYKIDCLFLPSLKMYDYIPFRLKKTIIDLPPAMTTYQLVNKKIKTKEIYARLNFIYVGGLGDLYDLTTFCSVIDDLKFTTFKLCTRIQEWINNKNVYIKYQNIEVLHFHGKELTPIYNISDIAVLFIRPTIYWEFVMAVKLFEYMAYRKPIIAVKGTAVGDFVSKNNIGWVIDFDEIKLKKLIEFLQNNPQEIKEKIRNIDLIAPFHTWQARALKVTEELSE